MRTRNCPHGHQCLTSRWDQLEKIPDSENRLCTHCGHEVHYCETQNDLIRLITQNKCVFFAIDVFEIECIGKGRHSTFFYSREDMLPPRALARTKA